MKFGLLTLLLFPMVSTAAEFFLGNEKVVSSVSEERVECGDYQILIKHDHFPLKYENDIPEEFRIEGFYGSRATVSKEAILLPSNIVVPQPENITNLKDYYPDNRTYLAGGATCKGNRLIISYWSGGNCKECEAFVEFNVKNGRLMKSYKKVNYSHVRVLSK